MGHFLGLLHTFFGGCKNNNCLKDGDRVCDTPPDDNNFPLTCTYAVNSCTTDEDDTQLAKSLSSSVSLGGLGDQNDLDDNYMDYILKNCRSAFTQGQADRMHFFVQDFFSALLKSKACYPPCSAMATAAFTASADSLHVGDTLFSYKYFY